MKLLQDLVPGCKQPLMSKPLNVNGKVKRGAALPPVETEMDTAKSS
ncbi:hypothetical protein SLEP1_g10376 [Rubroshorea leprosula]|uniref:Uncharacterized protein n=1 Tax=Rubroshorea leprosula TaxID=152421 RepID=A0AAV5IHV1_9ROSI|nr:hypothetical protein SLEP1_g10376 [Rubroshorea leprosula]